MLRIALRKMIHKKWLMLCLFTGLLIATSTVSSVLIYVNASQERMLIKDLEQYQINTNRFPGGFSLKIGLSRSSYGDASKDIYLYLDNKMKNEMVHQFGLPILCGSNLLTVSNLMILDEEQNIPGASPAYASLRAVSDLDQYIRIVHGRLYSNEKNSDAIEVIITSKAMENLGLTMNATYTLQGITEGNRPVKIRIVGIFTKDSRSDNAWVKNDLDFSSSVLMDYPLFHKEFENQFNLVESSEWNYSLDYRQIKGNQLEDVLSAHHSHMRLMNRLNRVELTNHMIQTVAEYKQRKNELLASLWALMTPVFMMLMIYVFMVSKMVIDSERNEIAVMKSRGGSRIQIIGIYALQGLLLSFVSVVIGPSLGMVFCNQLGSSNGFLEFVGRRALPAVISTDVYLFSLFVVVLFFMAILLPALSASQLDIVEHKKMITKNNVQSFWKKAFVDMICLCLAAYGYFRYSPQLVSAVDKSAGSGSAIDPVLFLASALFILGLSFFFLRLFPVLIKLLFLSAKKYWSPGLYASLIGLARANGQEQFILFFITLTVSIGFFNANTARTINRNREDRLRFEVGTDIKLLVSSSGLKMEEHFTNRFEELPGIKSSTRVFDSRNVSLRGFTAMAGSTTIDETTLMGVIPHEFASVAWYRNKLMPHHIIDYLNIMQHSPKAMLLSATFKEKYHLEKGDVVYIQNGSSEYVEGIVYEFVNYWPSFTDPNGLFVIANLAYLQDMGLDKVPEYWIKKEPSGSDIELYRTLNETFLFYKQVYTDDLVRKDRNDPKIQGTNGILTLGFIITILISMIGFTMYCVFSVNRRILQFGILRAMGLSRFNMVIMVLFEQFLITGLSILAGIMIGHFAGQLYIPIMDAISHAASQSIPSVITRYRGDYFKIYGGIACMLTLGFIVMRGILFRIKMTQALKLGED